MRRRIAILGLAPAAMFCPCAETRAQAVRVVETQPAAHAVMEDKPEGFLVRFDKPVDHVRSMLVIERAGHVVQTLHPRFKSAPEVLFARAQALPPGEYTLRWSVNTLDGNEVVQGEIPFSVAAGKPAPH